MAARAPSRARSTMRSASAGAALSGSWTRRTGPNPASSARWRALAEAPEEVGCVQCQLSYYNARENWVTRCFQLEYAIWFEVLLRGFQRLGLPIPLGGTSVYFRREALVTAGGWDAHNVTEDADLGMRLARRGLRTLVLDSVTEEEANCRCLTWVRQRSRWLKGYLLTWLSHVRDPVRLWREMGPRGFLGFNVLFLGAAVSYGAMPLFWLSLIGWVATGQSLWGQWLPGWILWPLALSLGGGQAIMLGCAALAMWRRRALDLMLWVPVLPFYWTLGAMAAWKAVAELFIAPYYWDKTRHGISRVFLRRRGPFAGEPVAVRAEGARPAPAGPTAPAPSVARPMAR
ncbi:MAG: glycosyltransferase [Pseudomonadota bacterium]